MRTRDLLEKVEKVNKDIEKGTVRRRRRDFSGRRLGNEHKTRGGPRHRESGRQPFRSHLDCIDG